MVHELNFSELVFSPRLVFTYSNSSNFHIFQCRRDLYSRWVAHTQSNRQWHDFFNFLELVFLPRL